MKKLIICAILIQTVAAAAIGAWHMSGRFVSRWTSDTNAVFSLTPRVADDKTAQYMAAACEEMQAKIREDFNYSENMRLLPPCVVRDDRYLSIVKLPVVVSGVITDYYLWFDFADRVDGLPTYTVMSGNDPVLMWSEIDKRLLPDTGTEVK